MGMSSSSENKLEDNRDTLVRNLGGNDLANNILIYPKSFDEKNAVTSYLDKWNDPNERIFVNGVEIPKEERAHVTYTDTLELIIKMIDTMIKIVSYALIAFTSISLVVSTVMIGIITYVSVVERIKEIGVIRSLGGRKKDVSHLFNAETFIIGSLAGLMGIGVTYLISLIVNLILKPLINYASIAALPITQAILLVVLSVLLTSISGLIPARSAAKKDPVVALRTE
jgi:putative ABC transport system permease protein